eukprot:gnl/TRDRNA2_/TRDRNA2_182445_c0_seq1.p1 gnl/TRDRNA2_/TRDRNA2_182445_c0~~gnl/TRDRNA2_/TRDRNA2_182445_c0_seq1.p1  ORF type:complete len:313 (+),score=48.80 gnl/TRDRNA2_/TRDRNA2_182445_c0_seq1:111-1049(+)
MAATTAPTKKRLSLVERQQQLLEERGFSKPAAVPAASGTGASALPAVRRNSEASTAASSSLVLGPSDTFLARQESLLIKRGRGNATRASRTAIPLLDAEEIEDGADEASQAGSMASRCSKAPSLHPSAGGVSLGLSEVSIGAGDDTGYWDFQHRTVKSGDLGHTCRECKQPFRKIGDPLTERRGARISMKYHGECFSGFADPRSQANSSTWTGRLAGTQMDAAPRYKATTKMRVSAHFDGTSGAASALTLGMGGKHGGQMGMGHNGFGSKSSKGKVPQRAPGGFTEGQLAAHDAHMEAINEDGAGEESISVD